MSPGVRERRELSTNVQGKKPKASLCVRALFQESSSLLPPRRGTTFPWDHYNTQLQSLVHTTPICLWTPVVSFCPHVLPDLLFHVSPCAVCPTRCFFFSILSSLALSPILTLFLQLKVSALPAASLPRVPRSLTAHFQCHQHFLAPQSCLAIQIPQHTSQSQFNTIHLSFTNEEITSQMDQNQASARPHGSQGLVLIQHAVSIPSSYLWKLRWHPRSQD